MTPPRNSPLTVQGEGITAVNGISEMNGINGMNGITNGHVDHHYPGLYNSRAIRPRRDVAPLQPQPAGSYQPFDHSYGYPSDPTGYYR